MRSLALLLLSLLLWAPPVGAVDGEPAAGRAALPGGGVGLLIRTRISLGGAVNAPGWSGPRMITPGVTAWGDGLG